MSYEEFREQCAKACENVKYVRQYGDDEDGINWKDECAKAIRAIPLPEVTHDSVKVHKFMTHSNTVNSGTICNVCGKDRYWHYKNYTHCNGRNCNAVNGIDHSHECTTEHDSCFELPQDAEALRKENKEMLSALRRAVLALAFAAAEIGRSMK